MSEGVANVGSIIVTVRADTDEYNRRLDEAEAKGRALGDHAIDVKVRSRLDPSALETLVTAENRLAGAKDRVALAEQRLQRYEQSGRVSAYSMMNARQALARAYRDEELAALHLDNTTRKLVSDQEAASKRMARDTAAAHGGGGGGGFWAGLLPFLPAATAAVPVAAVGLGALIGLVPAAATVELAIKGISAQMSSGALQGTAFANSVDTLKGDLSTLETTAASNIMGGLNTAMTSSQGLFGDVNALVAGMSTQLGGIAAGAAPALAHILLDLNPLFTTFGDLLVSGAQHLDHWATSSTAIQHFVGYVQTNLPNVVNLLDGLGATAAHLIEAVAPFGSVALNDVTLLTDALRLIPVGVLRDAVPPAMALYAALEVYKRITPEVTGAKSAIQQLGNVLGWTGPRAASAAAQITAANVQVQLSAAREAEAVALAKADEAEAAMQSAVEQAAAAEEAGSADAGLTRLIAENAIEQAASFRAAAVAATASAETIASEAEAAAAASDTAGEAASIGWAGMLGPIGALVVGGGIMAQTFLSSGRAAEQTAIEVNGLTEAIKQDSGAIGENTRQYMVNALQKAGALDDARKLGLSLSDVTDAALGNKDALNAITAETLQYQYGVYGATKDTSAQVAAARSLLAILGSQSGALANAKTAYGNETAAMGDTTSAANQQTVALNNLITAWQTASGNLLSTAQAETAYDQAVLTAIQTLKTNKGALDENTTAGVADRQAIEGAVSALQAKMQADIKAGQATTAATSTYRTSASTLLGLIGKLDGTKSAAYRYAKQLLDIPPVVKTSVQLSLQAQQFQAALAATVASAQRAQMSIKNALMMGAVGTGSGISHNATGTNYWHGGITALNERGPELVQLPRGSKVFTNRQAQLDMLSQLADILGKQRPSGAGAPSHMTVRIGERDFHGYVDEIATGSAARLSGQQAREFAYTIGR